MTTASDYLLKQFDESVRRPDNPSNFFYAHPYVDTWMRPLMQLVDDIESPCPWRPSFTDGGVCEHCWIRHFVVKSIVFGVCNSGKECNCYGADHVEILDEI